MSTQDSKRSELCPHMLAVVEYADRNCVRIAGPGDLGGAWLLCDAPECKPADTPVDEAFGVMDVQDAF